MYTYILHFKLTNLFLIFRDFDDFIYEEYKMINQIAFNCHSRFADRV